VAERALPMRYVDSVTGATFPADIPRWQSDDGNGVDLEPGPGITREQIGAWLMRHWDMPEELSSALRFQHDPSYAGDSAAFPNLVCLAVSLLRNRGIGAGPQNEIPDELFDALGLTREKAEDAVNKVLSAEVALRELAAQFQQPH